MPQVRWVWIQLPVGWVHSISLWRSVDALSCTSFLKESYMEIPHVTHSLDTFLCVIFLHSFFYSNIISWKQNTDLMGKNLKKKNLGDLNIKHWWESQAGIQTILKIKVTFNLQPLQFLQATRSKQCIATPLQLLKYLSLLLHTLSHFKAFLVFGFSDKLQLCHRTKTKLIDQPRKKPLAGSSDILELLK